VQLLGVNEPLDVGEVDAEVPRHFLQIEQYTSHWPGRYSGNSAVSRAEGRPLLSDYK